jgi:hypothetical protein
MKKKSTNAMATQTGTFEFTQLRMPPGLSIRRTLKISEQQFTKREICFQVSEPPFDEFKPSIRLHWHRSNHHAVRRFKFTDELSPWSWCHGVGVFFRTPLAFKSALLDYGRRGCGPRSSESSTAQVTVVGCRPESSHGITIHH